MEDDNEEVAKRYGESTTPEMERIATEILSANIHRTKKALHGGAKAQKL
jgi:hypothetical protein